MPSSGVGVTPWGSGFGQTLSTAYQRYAAKPMGGLSARRAPGPAPLSMNLSNAIAAACQWQVSSLQRQLMLCQRTSMKEELLGVWSQVVRGDGD